MALLAFLTGLDLEVRGEGKKRVGSVVSSPPGPSAQKTPPVVVQEKEEEEEKGRRGSAGAESRRAPDRFPGFQRGGKKKKEPDGCLALTGAEPSRGSRGGEKKGGKRKGKTSPSWWPADRVSLFPWGRGKKGRWALPMPRRPLDSKATVRYGVLSAGGQKKERRKKKGLRTLGRCSRVDQPRLGPGRPLRPYWGEGEKKEKKRGKVPVSTSWVAVSAYTAEPPP